MILSAPTFATYNIYLMPNINQFPPKNWLGNHLLQKPLRCSEDNNINKELLFIDDAENVNISTFMGI